jgi:hypothetical protein
MPSVRYPPIVQAFSLIYIRENNLINQVIVSCAQVDPLHAETISLPIAALITEVK